MLSCGHSMQSPAFPLDEVPHSSSDNPKRLVYMAGSGLLITAPVNVLVEAHQHSTPLPVSG